jgi:hypothetical protein
MGNGKAAYNLALMWKTGQGGEQSFEKAFEYAQASLKLGNERAYYMLGYLYYKGFGTEQNYPKAVEMFTKGAELKQASSTYFLGLCYLGGYGAEKDIVKGKEQIKQAANWGNDHAVEFIVQERNKKYEQPHEYQPKYRQIQNSADTAVLQGIWQGEILRYDYGKQQVKEICPLTLQLSVDENGDLSGYWVQSDSISMTVQAHKTDSFWQLQDMRYLQNWDRTWDLQTLRFAAETDSKGDTILYGYLEQFSPQTVEPSSPLVIELRRGQTNPEKNKPEAEKASTLNTINVYPNPFERDIELHIILQQAQKATVQVFDLSGKIFYTETCDLAKGSQTKKISLETLPVGAYAVSLKSDAVNLQTLIIRKP